MLLSVCAGESSEHHVEVSKHTSGKVWVEIYKRKSKFLPQMALYPLEAMENIQIRKQGLSNPPFFMLTFQAGSLELDNSYGP